MAKYTYSVAIPITGVVCVEVESDIELSEKDAIEQAMEKDVTSDDIEEWELHHIVVRGNVFYGMQNEAEVVNTEIEDDE